MTSRKLSKTQAAKLDRMKNELLPIEKRIAAAEASNVVQLPPRQPQIVFLVKAGKPLELVMTKTRMECIAKIAEIIKDRNAQSVLAGTEEQFRYLESQGYLRAPLTQRTRGFLSKLIFELKRSEAVRGKKKA